MAEKEFILRRVDRRRRQHGPHLARDGNFAMKKATAFKIPPRDPSAVAPGWPIISDRPQFSLSSVISLKVLGRHRLGSTCGQGTDENAVVLALHCVLSSSAKAQGRDRVFPPYLTTARGKQLPFSPSTWVNARLHPLTVVSNLNVRAKEPFAK